MGFGGRQAMAVHKLIGGRRVIDMLGPDDGNIHWGGQFYGDGAHQSCLAIDALRAQGSTLPLSFGGQSFTVVISEFHFDIRRYPIWVEYQITCVVSQNGGQGALGGIAAGIDSLVTSDLSAAVSLAN